MTLQEKERPAREPRHTNPADDAGTHTGQQSEKRTMSEEELAKVRSMPATNVSSHIFDWIHIYMYLSYAASTNEGPGWRRFALYGPQFRQNSVFAHVSTVYRSGAFARAPAA